MRNGAELAELVFAGAIPNLAYLALGLWLVRAWVRDARGAERLAIAYALGSGAASLAILGLRAVDIPVPLSAMAVLALAGVPALRGAGGASSPSSALPTVRSADRPSWAVAADGVAIALAGWTLLAALAPETFWDGFEYHLPMILAWSEGPIRALPAMVDSEFRVGVDLLYLPAVASGNSDAAALVSACFAAAIAALIRAEASRRASPGAGSLAGLFALVVPITIDNAVSTYVDLGVGLYGYLALWCADRWNREGNERDVMAAAVFAAFAANAKLHAAVLCPTIAILLAFGGRRPSLRLVGAGAGAFLLLTAPWFVKVALTTGNPVFPLLTNVFGSGDSSAELLDLRRFRLSTDFPVDRNLGGLLHYFGSIHFGRNPHVSGQLGPLPLALAPFALGVVRFVGCRRSTRVLVGSIAVLFVAQFAVMPAMRFGTPLYPFLAVAAALGGHRIASVGRLPAALLGSLLALLALHHIASLTYHYAPRVTALREPARYERARFPDQVALSEMVANAEPVVGIPKGAVLWMPKPVYNLHWERNGELYFERARPGRALAVLNRRGVRSLVIDVDPPHPADGRTGHRVVDDWLKRGLARLHPDPTPPRARGRRVWVRIDLDTTGESRGRTPRNP